MGPFNDYYEILGADPLASRDEIKHAYRNCVKENHPDLHPDDAQSQCDEMHLINEAYKVLSDPRKRGAYDTEWKNFYRSRGAIRFKSNEIQPSRGDARASSKTNTHSLRKASTDKALLLILIILLIIFLFGILLRTGYRGFVRDRIGNSRRLGLVMADNPDGHPALYKSS